MDEQLISLETAKLAKEKGFDNLYNKYFYTEENGLCSIECDGEVLNVFNDDLTLKSHTYCCNGDFWYDENKEEFYDPIKFPAVTQSLLQKRLRDAHYINIDIATDCTTEPKYCYNIKVFKGNPKDLGEMEWGWYFHEQKNWRLYYTYEKALEEGLQEALKLIK